MTAAAMEITCGRYIQEPGACRFLAGELKLISAKKAYIMGGRRALEAALARMEESLKAGSIDYHVAVFEGYCTYGNARAHADAALAAGCDVIIGVGGGKCMDAAKAAGKMIGLPLGNIPTQMATCVACTNMAIMYEDSGAFIGPLYPDLPIAFVLADTELLVREPPRYLASGIADAMAKYPEVHFSQRGTYSCAETDDAALQVAHGMSVATWNLLMENGRKAYTDCAKQVLSNEFSAVINTGLISTGIISGLARGSKQLAIAHAVYNHSTTVFPEVWRSYLHGEIVSVGLLLQQYYNNSPEEEISAYVRLCRSMGVPVCLDDLGLSGTPDELDRLHRAISADFTDFTAEESRRLRSEMERIIRI